MKTNYYVSVPLSITSVEKYLVCIECILFFVDSIYAKPTDLGLSCVCTSHILRRVKINVFCYDLFNYFRNSQLLQFEILIDHPNCFT